MYFLMKLISAMFLRGCCLPEYALGGVADSSGELNYCGIILSDYHGCPTSQIFEWPGLLDDLLSFEDFDPGSERLGVSGERRIETDIAVTLGLKCLGNKALVLLLQLF